MVTSDDLALAQTITLNAGKGYQFSGNIIDRLKSLMEGWGVKRFCFQCYASVLDGDKLHFERRG